VDGLLVLATVGLLRSGRAVSRRVRWAAWLSFVLGIVVPLAANIAAAPTLGWQPVLVAGWPPVALLLAVKLLPQRSQQRESVDTGSSTGLDCLVTGMTGTEAQLGDRPLAEQVMWSYFQAERARGRIPYWCGAWPRCWNEQLQPKCCASVARVGSGRAGARVVPT
jgi:hypothetical protein